MTVLLPLYTAIAGLNIQKLCNKYLLDEWMNKLSPAFIPVSYIAEKAMATHSSTLAWKIPWTEELGRLQSMGSLRVGHDWMTSLSLFTFMHWRRKWHSSVLAWRIPGTGEPGGVSGVAQSWTRLKRLCSSSYIPNENLKVFLAKEVHKSNNIVFHQWDQFFWTFNFILQW